MRLRSDHIINFTYKEYFPLVRFLVIENGGSGEDVADIFQDGNIILYSKISLNQLSLTSSFKTYLYSVCRNLRLQKLNKRKVNYDKLTDVDEFIDLPNDLFLEASIEEAELHRIIQIHFLFLPKDCQKV